MSRTAYLFRFRNNKGSTDNRSEYVGIAVGRTREDLFHTIDAHGDPYSCEIYHICEASICVKRQATYGADGICENEEFSCLETGGDFLNLDELRWQKPVWPKALLAKEKNK